MNVVSDEVDIVCVPGLAAVTFWLIVMAVAEVIEATKEPPGMLVPLIGMPT